MVFILKHSFQTGVVVLLSICFDIGFVKAEKKNAEFTHFENNLLDITMMPSKNEKYVIYRNTGKKECYVEALPSKISSEEQQSRTLYVSKLTLAESDSVYEELKTEIVEFCKSFPVFVLREQPPLYQNRNASFRERRQPEM